MNNLNIGYLILLAVLVISVSIAASQPAEAADIVLYEDGYVGIHGRTEMTDVPYLLVVLDKHPEIHTVIISGPGGYALAGVGLAHIIHDYGLNTHASDNCYSACAIAWIAGKRKTVGTEVGVYQHGVYYEDKPVEGSLYLFWLDVLVNLYNKVAPERTAELVALISNNKDNYLKLN